jgi:hypothetical protein
MLPFFKKIYFSGAISLIGIPILLSFNKAKLVHNKTYSLSLVVPGTNNLDYYKSFSESEMLSSISHLYKFSIDLDGNEVENNQKLKWINQTAKMIHDDTASSAVLKISLSNQTSYHFFIQLIDMCYMNSFKRFILHKNELFILPFAEKPKNDSTAELAIIRCGTSSMTLKIKNGIKKADIKKESLLLYSGWLSLLFVSFYVKRNSFTPLPSSIL